jgi:two-component system CheB/CheR fusion protein
MKAVPPKAKSRSGIARKDVRKRASKANALKSNSQNKDKSFRCPIVGVGGSAGGFEAAMELLKHLPPTTGMAFVVVQHLDPHHVSRLAGLLGKVTRMPVMEVVKRVKPQPNVVYVQPPNKCLICQNGALNLVQRTQRLNLAIDQFFESLAEEQGSRAIGVVLSGSGSDGTVGLRAIKAAGGLTYAQDEQSAKFPSMPRHAVVSGSVDAALSPAEIAREICRIADHPYIQLPPKDGNVPPPAILIGDNMDELGRIFLTLKQHTGVDFASYKQSTLQRRIHRRMALHRIEQLGRYARFLRESPEEIRALFNDLLINVTRFFRDPEAFEALKKRFIPALMKIKKRLANLRVWVPGCATGEEVYSFAICILETLGRSASTTRIQIFGTDLSEMAIDRARLGVYSSAIEKDVSTERLRRFFKKLDSTYQINRSVRDLCTFARQNITADPPFSRLDLISCRNVLIYLGPALQRRAMPIFHYALNPSGYLILGPSETVGVFGDMFELVDKRAKIYAKKILPGRPEFDLHSYPPIELKVMEPRPPAPPHDRGGDDFNIQVQQVADRIMLGAYAPCGIVIDSNMNVRQFRGQTGLYLEHIAGPATFNLLHMTRPTLVPDLRAIIHRAFRTKQPVRKERALLKYDDKVREVTIEAIPFNVPTSETTWLLVIFKDDHDKQGWTAKKLKKAGTPERELMRLREELSASKESLQAIIEEQEATNEELKSANEEIESSNEELQSTNEELETAKEELQSTNEELTTLNEELSNRNLEVMQVNSDLNNLLSSVHLPIVMVDSALTVRRATPTARKMFNILDTDIGRRLSDLRPKIEIPNLENLLHDVIDTLSVREKMVRDREGHVYSLRIRPYRTAENKIDGAVMTLVDIDGKNQPRNTKGKT